MGYIMLDWTPHQVGIMDNEYINLLKTFDRSLMAPEEISLDMMHALSEPVGSIW